jgi:alpha-beta hydrolase superfamily lysophospholipase
MPVHADDLRGLLRLGADAGLGVADIAEGLHHSVLSPFGLARGAAPGRTAGLTGFIYRAVRKGLRLGGDGGDALIGLLTRLLPAASSTPQREALLAILNGVWGDHLVASGNPLAIRSALRVEGRALLLESGALAAQLPEASGRILLLAHGLCMNDLQWQRRGHDHGRMLARERGWTPVSLHYNSGRHVSENGADLDVLLEALVEAWPVRVEELAIVGHSMGGLVARSACHRAQGLGRTWPGRLGRMVFLGTPHHGAPLERGGHMVDRLLGSSAYAAPFARLGLSRSAGITDLRFGNVQDADWQGRERVEQRHDDRRPTPLPNGVASFLVAATTAEHASARRSRWIGDRLVPLGSALGEHPDPALALEAVPAEHRLIVTRADHWDLLSRPEVSDALRRWLA